MATEYKLPYAASEISRKLATVDEIDAKLTDKADLIDGKILISQLPDDIFGDDGNVELRGGVTVRKITFTDRESLYQWLLLNYHKTIHCSIINDEYPWYVRFMVHRVVQGSEGDWHPGVDTEFSLVQISAFPSVTLVPSYIRITSDHTEYISDEYININSDGSVIGTNKEPIIVSDEQWRSLNTNAIVYYFASEMPTADLSIYYTKTEVDDITSEYYTKSEIDNIALNGTVNLSNYYTKSETNTTLSSKADLVNGKIPVEQLPADLGEGILGVSSEAIIDVVSLPTENIKTNVFYRLVDADFIHYGVVSEGCFCRCVNGLPEIGEPCTNIDMTTIIAYYNTQDNSVYGYVDDMLSVVLGIPSGWYDMEMLLSAVDFVYGGVITDIEDISRQEEIYVLLKQHLYMYQDGWVEMVFARNKKPKIDISWDGVVGDKFALDLSALGFEGMQYVKVSDEVLTVRDILGCKYSQIFADGSSYENEIADDFVEENSQIDMNTYPGAISIDGGVMIICYSSDDTNAALGLPEGYLTNGVYFIHSTEGFYTNRLVAPNRISKIGSEYVDVNVDEVWENIYTINRNLNDFYTKSEIDNLITNAISGAIGGSY